MKSSDRRPSAPLGDREEAGGDRSAPPAASRCWLENRPRNPDYYMMPKEEWATPTTDRIFVWSHSQRGWVLMELNKDGHLVPVEG